MTTSEPNPTPAPPTRTFIGLSFGDGFQFGCGFFVAGLVAGLALVLLLAVVGLVLSLAGFSLFPGLFG